MCKVIERVIDEPDKCVPATVVPLSPKKPRNPPLPWFLSCKSTLTLATDIHRWEFPFIQERFWDAQDIIMLFVLIIRALTQLYISRQVPCRWTRVETTRLVFNMHFFSALIVFVLSPGAKAGVEGNQRTARPSLSLHELPEARRGCSCAPVLPCSRWACAKTFKNSMKISNLTEVWRNRRRRVQSVL